MAKDISMQQYEYKTITDQGGEYGLNDSDLNRLGQEGWLLVAAAGNKLFFMRPKVK